MNSPESSVNRIAGSPPLAPSAPGAARLRTARLEVFARILARGLPALEAAREAGYVGISPENARRNAQLASVRARVAYLTREEEEVERERRAILAERQWLVHERNIADYYEEVEEPRLDKDGIVVRDAQGDPVMRMAQRLKPFSRLTREQLLCIEGLTFTEKGKPNLKLYNQMKANEELRKLYGLDAPPKHAVDGTIGLGVGGVTIQVITGVPRAPDDPPLVVEHAA